ncbi:hypothetical protein KIPB_014947, partial [Kipferlia bialata]
VNFVGSLIVGLSTDHKSYPLLLLGRLIFGLSGEANTCLNDTVVGKWFRSSMLSTAYAVTLTVSRLGSIVTMWVSPRITANQLDETTGIDDTTKALWLATIVGFLSAAAACMV